jgi:hypothetical protein
MTTFPGPEVVRYLVRFKSSLQFQKYVLQLLKKIKTERVGMYLVSDQLSYLFNLFFNRDAINLWIFVEFIDSFEKDDKI